MASSLVVTTTLGSLGFSSILMAGEAGELSPLKKERYCCVHVGVVTGLDQETLAPSP